MASITCGNCAETHQSAFAVRACHDGATILPSCDWIVQSYDEDGPIFLPCGAEVAATDTGWTCAHGHEHVTAEARHAEGWDYAESWGEAQDLAAAGTDPRTMDGHLVLGPGCFQHA